MSITLKWTNPPTLDEVQVFRSDTPLAAGALPTGSPLTVITDKSVSYTDEATVQNKYYYYTLAFKTGEDVVYSPQSVAINMPYTGPGPQTIATGTWERGIFGPLSVSEIVTNQELQAMVGSGVAYPTAANWLKLIWKGKILFVPLSRSVSGISWNALYLAGLIYGVSGPGPATGHGLAATDQLKIFTKGEHDFVVRTPRCQSTPDYSWSGVLRDNESEWINMVCACFLQNSNWPALDLADYPQASWFDTSAVIFTEFSGNNVAYLQNNTPSNITAPNATMLRSAATMIWRPVLELVL